MQRLRIEVLVVIAHTGQQCGAGNGAVEHGILAGCNRSRKRGLIDACPINGLVQSDRCWGRRSGGCGRLLLGERRRRQGREADKLRYALTQTWATESFARKRHRSQSEPFGKSSRTYCLLLQV